MGLSQKSCLDIITVGRWLFNMKYRFGIIVFFLGTLIFWFYRRSSTTINFDEIINVLPTKYNVLPTKYSVLPTKYSVLPTKYSVLPTVSTKRKGNITKKLVLFYNRPSDWHHQFDGCEYKNCEFTDNRADFGKSDAILFHAPVVYRRLDQLPPKPRGQIWIYMSQEPPSEVFTSFKEWRNVFNWTWTNRRDSDIFDPYGEIGVREQPINIDYASVLENKSKTAYWYVSHCKTQGKREVYLRILKKFISFDIYGKCVNSTAEKLTYTHKYEIAQMYKFYLAFENSLCRDYITEKVLHMITRNIVPVIRGEPNVELFLPNGSYIDAKHFHSAIDLGLYLQKLQSNHSEYLKYFSWKKHYRAFQIGTRGICSMCKLLHKADEHRSLYDNIDAWVNNPGGKPVCDENPADIPLDSTFSSFDAPKT